MVTVRISRKLYERSSVELEGRDEQVGFFLADFDWDARAFNVHDWRAVPADGFEDQGPYHVTLTDDAKVEVIRWAWDAGLCLVEAHSHGDLAPAEFSPSDLWGLKDWVPHLMWRLRGRPYAALVVAQDAFDGLAWVSGADAREPIENIEVDDGAVLRATGLTTKYLTRGRGAHRETADG
jgi:hypothetical protein